MNIDASPCTTEALPLAIVPTLGGLEKSGLEVNGHDENESDQGPYVRVA